MVALAILSASLMAVADLSGGALRNFAYARDLSDATLLARGKLAELEERFEDSGFRDADETLDGDFSDLGRPDVRWKAEVLRPTAKLTAEQLLAVFLGSSPDDADTQQMLAKILGGAAGGAPGGAGSGGGTSGPAGGAAALAPGGALGTVLQAQLKTFAEELRRALRELRLTVTWKDGRRDQGLTVATHLVVLNPKAPGGARGASPDVPANISEPPSPGSVTPALPGVPAAGAVAPIPGLRPSRRPLPPEGGEEPGARPRPIRTPRGTHLVPPPRTE
jgi:general secretion pathway protein I